MEEKTVRCEILTEFSQLQRLSTAWLAWMRRDASADMFQYWEWADAYWQAYGQDLTVWSPVVYEGQEPIAILPLVRRRGNVEFLSTPWSDYNDIICAEHCSPAVLEVALRAMLRESDDWSKCVLDRLPSDSRIVRYLEAIPQELRIHLQLLQGGLSPTILLDDTRAELLKKLAKKHQYYHQKLNKQGRVTFRHLDTQEQARGHLDNFFHHHITRWALVGSKSEFLSPDHRNFYRAMVDKLNLQEDLRFGVLELDGKPIAYHFGFQIHGKLTYYKPAFDVNYWDFCPGGVLLRCLFQYAAEARLTEFDFSRGAEPYKYRYCNCVKHTCILYIDRRPNHVASRVRQIERRARESIRTRPSWAQAINRIPVLLRNCYLKCLGADLKQTLLGAFGQLIWRRTEAAIFYRSGDEEGEPASATVIGESLTALAVLIMEWPELMSHARLMECRKRLKAGDRMVAVIGRGEQAPVVLWAGKRAEISLPLVSEQWKLSLAKDAWVVYDIWLAPGQSYQSVSCDILRVAFQQPQDHGVEHWVVCSDALRLPHSAVEGARFQLKTRVSHRALLYWFRNTQVSEAGEDTGRGLTFHETV